MYYWQGYSDVVLDIINKADHFFVYILLQS